MNWLAYLGIGLAKVNSRLIIKFCVIDDGMANWMGYHTSPRKSISVSHCVVCKTTESVIRDCVVTHLDIVKGISITQHGFTRGQPCQSNLIIFMDILTRILDSGHGYIQGV